MEKKIKSIELYRTNVVPDDAGEENLVMDEYMVNRTVYDEDGNETERITYSPDGEAEERILVKYSNGHPVEEMLELEGELAEKTTREFDEAGTLLLEFRHYQDGEPDKISYTYEDGKPVQKLVTDSDGDEGEKFLWHYEDGKLVKGESYNEYGNIDLTREHSYNEAGHLEEIIETRISDGDKLRIVTLFDEAGHLLQEKHYDRKGNLVSRSTTIIGDNGLPAQTENETTMGKTISVFTYDEKGNNIKLEEKTTEGEVFATIERHYDEAGRISGTEVHMEPALNRPGQHYSLAYKYEFYS